MHGITVREITKYTVIYDVNSWFWTTLQKFSVGCACNKNVWGYTPRDTEQKWNERCNDAMTFRDKMA
jgi:hypothetical protein